MAWNSSSRLIASIFLHLRVSDVRQFVASARPALAATEFVLMTTFPNKELTDESLTLKEANLLNAVIVQRLKWQRHPSTGLHSGVGEIWTERTSNYII